MATCPKCGADIEPPPDAFEDLEVGDSWTCEDCGTDLCVSDVEPLEFDVVAEEDGEPGQVSEMPEGESLTPLQKLQGAAIMVVIVGGISYWAWSNWPLILPRLDDAGRSACREYETLTDRARAGNLMRDEAIARWDAIVDLAQQSSTSGLAEHARTIREQVVSIPVTRAPTNEERRAMNQPTIAFMRLCRIPLSRD